MIVNNQNLEIIQNQEVYEKVRPLKTVVRLTKQERAEDQAHGDDIRGEGTIEQERPFELFSDGSEQLEYLYQKQNGNR